MRLPEVSNYGHYESDNYGAHTLKVDLGTIDLFYSYKTIVAYRDNQDGLVVSQNVWGTTTGKHLNWIHENHYRRIPYEEFCGKLTAALARHLV